MNEKIKKGVLYSGLFNYAGSNYFTTGYIIQGILKKAPQLRLGAEHNMWR